MVNNIEQQAHALTPLLTTPLSSSSYPRFPFLTLLISGGHTMILLALSNTRFKLLATTVDEAVGRTIDKVARNLGLEWKGRAPGAALEAFCRDGIPGVRDEDLPKIDSFKIPFNNVLSFSFSGLHSMLDRYILKHGVIPATQNDVAVASNPNYDPRKGGRIDLKRIPILPDAHRLAVARAFQDAAISQLESKVILALEWCSKNRATIVQEMSALGAGHGNISETNELLVSHIVVSGGVASNAYLRKRFVSYL